MNTLIKYITSISITFLLILSFAFITAVSAYFDLFNNAIYKGILLLFLVISIFSGSYYLGYNSNDKGYLRGLIFGMIISIIFLIINIVSNSLNASSFIYFFIIIITSLIGGTIGINKKTTYNK